MEDFEAADLLNIVELFHDERKKAYAREDSLPARAAIAVEMSDLEYIAATIRGHQAGSGSEDVDSGHV